MPSGEARAAVIIDFESLPIGTIADGTSVGPISFFTTNGPPAALQIVPNGGSPGMGLRHLASFGNGQTINGLEMRLDGVYNGTLQLFFGNDQPQLTAEGDFAEFSLYLGPTLKVQTTLTFNRNTIVDQAVLAGATAFDRATLIYKKGDGSPLTLVEIVDNITFDAVRVLPPRVSEPAGLALIAAGLLGLCGLRRKRRLA